MALHENDYDIAKTIDFFLEGGGDLSQDWKTAGIRTKKTNLSPNQTLAEESADELLVNSQSQNSNRNNKSNHQNNNNNKQQQNESSNNNNVRSRERNRNQAKQPTNNNNNKLNKNKNDSNNNGPPSHVQQRSTTTGDVANVDESNQDENRFMNSMDLNKENSHTTDQYYNRNNKRGNYSSSARGGSVGGGNGSSVNGNNYRGGGGGNRNGTGGRGSRSIGNSRGANNNNNLARNHQQRIHKDDQNLDLLANENSVLVDDKSETLVVVGTGNVKTITEFDSNHTEVTEPIELREPSVGKDATGVATDLLSNNKKYSNTVGRSSKDDNLRDIGTWTNEQADKNSSNRSSSSHNKPTNFSNNNNNINSTTNSNRQNNRFNNNKGVNNLRQSDDWENEEEWQGDLTQTQIFTASAQKKDENIIGALNSDFPIGHFNAEEAAQKIKNAVGVSRLSIKNTFKYLNFYFFLLRLVVQLIRLLKKT